VKRGSVPGGAGRGEVSKVQGSLQPKGGKNEIFKQRSKSGGKRAALDKEGTKVQWKGDANPLKLRRRRTDYQFRSQKDGAH